MVKYEPPKSWLIFDPRIVVNDLATAKASVIALMSLPYQRSWADELQKVQLKREIAGTSRIEGAEFTDNELDAALEDSPDDSFTRSQRQAQAAQRTYRWIASVPDDRPIDANLIVEIHGNIIKGADDDHCSIGRLRQRDENVTFGVPSHRGAEGGAECETIFHQLLYAMNHEFKGQDLLIQALALHYHFASIHPFADGNGRTARALEALLLQRAGLKDLLFIAMSNYYYEEKHAYLSALAQVRAQDHDLTPFLSFALRGISSQCNRLLKQIKSEVSKALFRDVMHILYRRLKNQRKRVIVERQVEILNCLLEAERMEFAVLYNKVIPFYESLAQKQGAFIRDVIGLAHLGALSYEEVDNEQIMFYINLKWPTEVTETDLFKKFNSMPEAKTHWYR